MYYIVYNVYYTCKSASEIKFKIQTYRLEFLSNEQLWSQSSHEENALNWLKATLYQKKLMNFFVFVEMVNL